jgi:hypothetical protein
MDHVGYGLFPEVMAKLQAPTGNNALTDVVEEGSRPKLAQDRRRRAARSTTALAGSKRPTAPSALDDTTDTLGSAAASVSSMQLGGLKATMAAKRDTPARHKSRAAGALLATIGIARPFVRAPYARSIVDAAPEDHPTWQHIEPPISIPVPQQQKVEMPGATRPTKRSRRGQIADGDIYSEATGLPSLSSVMGLLPDSSAASAQLYPPDVVSVHVRQPAASCQVITRDISSLSALPLGSGVQGAHQHVEAWASALRKVVAPFEIYKGRWWVQENAIADEPLDIPVAVLQSMVAMALHRPQNSGDSDDENL